MKKAAILALLLALASIGNVHAADPQPFERGSWSKLMATHEGQPTIVHLWGLTCAPCLTELPHWANLQKERPDMRLVLLAADPVPQPPARVEEMLTRTGLGETESWSFADRFNERLRYEIDPSWSGELTHPDDRPRRQGHDPAGCCRSCRRQSLARPADRALKLAAPPTISPQPVERIKL